MRFRLGAMICLAAMIGGSEPSAAAEHRLAVRIRGLARGQRLPARAAFCAAEESDPQAHDVSPEVRWSKGPAATRSYVLLMVDPDVPADLSLIGRKGVEIAADAPRQTVYHWVLADIPAGIHRLGQGVEGSGLIAHGKPVGYGPIGIRGVNVYTQFLRDVPTMAGTYGGYDGPCPPENDARTHRYIVTVYALDVPNLGLAGAFDGGAVEAAMAGHVLARGSATALYDRRARQS